MCISRDEYTAVDIANYVAYRISEIDPDFKLHRLKLKNIVFYCYVHYYQKTGKRLFKEPINKWIYGPTIMSIFHAFKGFGYTHVKPVTQFKLLKDKGFVDVPFDIDHFNEKDKLILNSVIDRMYSMKTKEMVDMALSDLSYKDYIIDVFNGYKDHVYTDEEIINFGVESYDHYKFVENNI